MEPASGRRALSELQRMERALEGLLRANEQQRRQLDDLREAVKATVESLSVASEGLEESGEQRAVWPQWDVHELDSRRAEAEADARRAVERAEAAAADRQTLQHRMDAAADEVAHTRARLAVLEHQMARLQEELGAEHSGDDAASGREDPHQHLETIQRNVDRAREHADDAHARYVEAGREAERASAVAADAAAKAERALMHRDQLAAEHDALRRRRARGQEPTPASPSEPAGAGPPAATVEAKPRTRRPSARVAVLRALDDFQCALSTEELGELGAFYGLKDDALTSRRFGSLRRDEVDAYHRGTHRDAWVAAALDDEGRAVKNLWASSTLPLDHRVVPTTSEVTHLRLVEVAAAGCNLVDEHTPASEAFENWVLSACGRARLLRGIFDDVPRWRRTKLLQECREKATQMLASQWARSAREERERAAGCLAEILEESELLFGTDVTAGSKRAS